MVSGLSPSLIYSYVMEHPLGVSKLITSSHSILKAAAWTHFGFYEDTNKRELGKTHMMCEVCHTNINYLGTTSNLRNHVSRIHLERLPSTSAAAKETADPVQPTLPTNTGKRKRRAQSVAAFIGKHLQHYSVVVNTVSSPVEDTGATIKAPVTQPHLRKSYSCTLSQKQKPR